MKIDTRLKPELIVGTDETYYQLHDPYLDAGEQKLVATDGRVLVAFPVEATEGEASRYVDKQLLRAARKWARSSGTHPTAEIVGDAVVGGPTWPTEQARKFPEWKQAVPEKKRGDPGTVTIALDAHLLKNIALALGAREDVPGSCQVVITAATNGADPMSVSVVHALESAGGAVAVLMPVSFERDAKGLPVGVKVVPAEPAP